VPSWVLLPEPPRPAPVPVAHSGTWYRIASPQTYPFNPSFFLRQCSHQPATVFPVPADRHHLERCRIAGPAMKAASLSRPRRLQPCRDLARDHTRPASDVPSVPSSDSHCPVIQPHLIHRPNTLSQPSHCSRSPNHRASQIRCITLDPRPMARRIS
jgi:hypothetical protein